MNYWLWLIFATLHVPFLFLGYGSAFDNYAVVESGKALFAGQGYEPSRYPGFFVHEALVGMFSLASMQFGPLLVSMLGSAGLLVAVDRICGHFDVPQKEWILLAIMVQPVYLVAANSVIDFIPAMALNWWGFWHLLRGKPLEAGILWGLAIGCRQVSFVFALLCLIVAGHYGLTRRQMVWQAGILTALIGTAVVGLPFRWAGYLTDPFWYFLWVWEPLPALARFVYKNVYFWGIPGMVVLVWVLWKLWENRRSSSSIKWKQKPLATLCLAVIVAYELLFLKLPWQQAFLLPILPCILILLALRLKDFRVFGTVFLAAMLLYNVLNINFARPDVPNDAKQATVGVWLEKGYTEENVQHRREVAIWYATLDFQGFTEKFYPRTEAKQP
jgi:hypothetical protein